MSNLKLFDIDPTQFASQVQLGVACSASVHEDHLEGTLTQKVQIQGNQVSFIASLLQGDLDSTGKFDWNLINSYFSCSDQYGIPKKFIDGLELATKKKK